VSSLVVGIDDDPGRLVRYRLTLQKIIDVAVADTTSGLIGLAR